MENRESESVLNEAPGIVWVLTLIMVSYMFSFGVDAILSALFSGLAKNILNWITDVFVWIVIATGNFFICKINEKNLWWSPLASNLLFIIAFVSEMNLHTGVALLATLLLSFVAGYFGTQKGN